MSRPVMLAIALLAAVLVASLLHTGGAAGDLAGVSSDDSASAAPLALFSLAFGALSLGLLRRSLETRARRRAVN